MRDSISQQTRGEEIANSLTHGLGLALSVAGLAVLVVLAALRGTTWHIVSCAVYGTTLVLLYGASTLYHGVRGPRVKRVLRVLDHSAIYLLIAGTYTPFALVTLRGAWGWSLFGVVWGLALLGILWKMWFVDRFVVVSTTVYLLMGWLAVIAAKPLLAALPLGGIAWILAGGLCYTAGVVFFGWKRLPYAHTVWHVLVVAGSVCHFLAVLLYVIPRSN